MDTIKVLNGFPSTDAGRVAELFDEAFENKFKVAIPDLANRIQFWGEAINPNQCISAYFDSELVGIALFATKSASGFKSESGKILQRKLGLIGALRAGFVFSLFTYRPQKGEMYIEAISVSSKVRGQGVGKLLLDKLVEIAKEDSQIYLSLKVILENERALKLYEREGFKIAKTQRSRFVKLIVGIQGAHKMEKRIN